MAIDAGTAVLGVDPDLTKLNQTLGTEVPKVVGDVAKKSAELFAGIFAGKKLIDLGKAGFDELAQGEKVAAQTAVQLRNLGSASDITSDHVSDLAGSIKDLAGFDDEAVQSGENMLLQFRSIGSSTATFDRATRDAADLAIAMGTDVPQAAQVLGRALEAPDKATRSLRQANIILTAAQQEQIKSAVDSGNQALAQSEIFQILEDRVGGSAKAFGETLPGQIKIAQESAANAKGALVAGLAPALELVAKGAENASTFITELPGPLRTVVSVGAAAGVGLGAIVKPAGDLLRLLDQVRTVRAGSSAATTIDTSEELANAAAKAAAADAALGLSAASGAAVAGTAGLAVAEEAVTVASAEMAASETVAATATGALLAALGPIGLLAVAAAATAAVFGLSQALGGGRNDAAEAKTATDALTTALKKNSIEAETGALTSRLYGNAASDMGKKAGSALQGANIPLKSFFDEVKNGTSDLGRLQHNGSGVFSTLTAMRIALVDAANGGSTFAASLLAAVDAGTLTKEGLQAILQQANILSGSYSDAKSQLDLTNGAATELGVSLDDIGDTSGVDAQKTAIEALKQTVEELRQKYDDALRAQTQLAPAAIRVQRGAIDLESSKAKVGEAAQALSDARATGDATKIADAQRDLDRANLDLQQSTLDLAQANTDLKVTQDAAIGVTDDQAAQTQLLEDNLNFLNAGFTGPTHDSIQGFIDDMEAAKAATAGLADLLNNLPSEPLKEITGRDDSGHAVRRFAAGGNPLAGEVFRGAENGFEVMLHDGLYQSMSGGHVLNHADSADFLSAGRQRGSGGVHQVNHNYGLLPEEALELNNRKLGWALAGTAAT